MHDMQMTELIDGIAARLDGHTLVLFTSYGPLKRVWSLLQDRLDARGIASLAQGLDGTRRQILQSFLADPRTVLLATSSFWEGVDIPGDRLRCVVIDKLPFPVPTDPLVRARSERLRDPFGEYILPVAIIRLRQGFGRLIRSASDRGAVVLCDPRLRTRQYGLGFLRALPPAPMAVSALAAVPAMVDGFVNTGDIARDRGRIRRMVLERSRTGVMAETAGAPVLDEAAPLEAPRPASDPAGSVIVALAQCYPKLGDVAANLAMHLEIVDEAAAHDAGLVVFPELSMTGYFLKDQVPDVALRLDSKEVRTLIDASRRQRIDIVAGLVLESDSHRFYNASVYIASGEVLHVHRKVYLPTYGLFYEQRYVAAGDRFRAFDAPLGDGVGNSWRAGMLICEDLWHPSAAVLLARQGMDMLVCPSASPGRGVLQGEALGTARKATT